MFNKTTVAIGILAIHSVFAEVVNLKNKGRFARNLQRNTTLATENAVLNLKVAYLCHLLAENEIPMTSFDHIALIDFHEE